MKLLQISNIAAFIIMILTNYLSNTGIFNGNTISSVSAKYQNLFTPAGYTFSIWTLIYVALAAFVIYQGSGLFNKGKVNEVVPQIGWWFVISCIANSLWVIAWIYDYTGLSVLIMLLLIFSLIKIILRTNMELDDPPLKRVALLWWPFSLYSGWLAVALFANVSAYLTKINLFSDSVSEITRTIIMILIAGGIYLFVTWNRNMREFAFVGVWGLSGIVAANANGSRAVALTAFVIAVIVFISFALHAYKNREYYPWRIRN